MSQPTIYSIVRRMESSIDLISENTTEAEYLFKMDYPKKPKSLLMAALEHVEETLSIIRSFVENGGSLDDIIFKATSKELNLTIPYLQEPWISGAFNP